MRSASTVTPLLVVKQVLTFVNVYQSVVPDILNRKFYGYSKIIAASVSSLVRVILDNSKHTCFLGR
jgi:hypothetical protein